VKLCMRDMLLMSQRMLFLVVWFDRDDLGFK
jgi:hypothetical protein